MSLCPSVYAKLPQGASPNIFCNFTYFKKLLLFKKFWDNLTAKTSS